MVVQGAQIASMAVQLAFWTLVLGVVVLVGIGIFLLTQMLYRLMKYKIEAIILDHTGSSEIARKDLGKIEKEGGNVYVKFLKSREKIPLPSPDKYIAFGNKKLLLLHKWNDLLTPMGLKHKDEKGNNLPEVGTTIIQKIKGVFKKGEQQPVPVTENLKPVSISHKAEAAFEFNADDLVTILRWRELDHQEALDTYSNKKLGFMDKYGALVVNSMMILIMFVLFFILLQKLGALQIHVDTSQLVRAA